MNWGLVCNPGVKRTVSLAKDIVEFLHEHGNVLVEESIASEIQQKGSSFKEINKNADIVVTIGGDGTILMTMSEIEKPVFAINSGYLYLPPDNMQNGYKTKFYPLFVLLLFSLLPHLYP